MAVVKITCTVLALVACVIAGSSLATTDVKKVHIVFMNHLDVGYASFINEILNSYFQEFFPRAAALGHELSKGGYLETFKYTTHPWLVSMYLDCPPELYLAGIKLKCPNTTQVAEFKAAVAAGYITWHAGPMNMQPENMDESLWEFGLRISQDLDSRFGITRKARVLSQRDVPGMTQAVVPSLVKMGIIGVSVGVNPSTSPPALPGRIVRWSYGNATVLGTWHPGGYPNNPGPNPANPGGISRDDCVIIDNFPEALCFAFRTDNSGPPVNLQEILGYYEILRKEFPGADLQASTLEDFMVAVQPIAAQLPLVTQEVGDTWIQGVGSDPRKCAEYRAVSTVLGNCVKSGACLYNDTRVYNSSRLLVKLGEHTWGLPTTGDSSHWSNPQLADVINKPNFVNCSKAWLEQRNFTYIAIDALEQHPVVKEMVSALEDLQPQYPDLNDYTQVAFQDTRTFTCGSALSMSLSLDGSITGLTYNKTNWASPTSPLAKFLYVSYSEKDFDDFGRVYNYGGGSAGFYKRNSTVNAHEQSRHWPVTMRELYVSNTEKGCKTYVHLQPVERRATQWYGAPQDIWVHYSLTTAPPGLDITLQLFEKTRTRLPEAIFFAFQPMIQQGHSWRMSKLGQLVDPANVILNGSQYQHITDQMGVSYSLDAKSPKSGIRIRSPDVPLVCTITTNQSATVFPAPLEPITAEITGMAYNLYNNIWDTNYILWYPYAEEDKDFKSRFRIEFISEI